MSNNQTMTIYRLYLRLINYVSPYRLVFSLALLCIALMAVTDAILPVLIKPMLDHAIGNKNQELFQLITIIIVLLFVVRSVASYISIHAIHWVNNTLIVNLQISMFDKLLTQPPHYYDCQTNESLISKFTSGVIQVAENTTKVTTILIKNTLTIIGLLVWMFYLNWELSLLVLMMALVVMLSIQLICGKDQETGPRIRQPTEDFVQVILESIKSHKVLTLDGGQKYETHRFQNEANQACTFNMKRISTNAFKIPLVQIVIAITITTFSYLAIQQVPPDKTIVGSFVSYIVSMLILSLSLKQLTNVSKLLQGSLAASEGIFSILDLESESDSGAIIIDRARGELRFEHVSFYHAPEEKAILNDITLTINPGEKIALVGSSDDSMNTFANLIPRFIQPTHGRILLDGHELTTLKLASLRSNISLVSQEVPLFNDTIAANIAFSKMECATEGEIIAAAQAAHAIEFIREMPQGMQTQVGIHGIQLSKVQRQQIAISRALLKNPPIIILEELNTTLDPESEHYIQEALETLMQNRTSITIARRRATLEKADCIFVIEQNYISEIGGHLELLAMEGIYAKLFRSQF
jgi:subfamily B ATP-binding cassette protein MsbA